MRRPIGHGAALAVRDPRTAITAAVVLGGFASFELSRRYAAGHHSLPILLAAALAGVLLVRFTRLAFVAWLVVVATVFPDRVLSISAGTLRTDLGEILAFAILGAVVVRWALGDRLRRPIMVIPLSLIVAAGFVGTWVSLSHDYPRSEWLASLKTLLLYFMPLAAVALHRTKADVDALERWVLRICVVGASAELLSAAIGAGRQNAVTQVVTLGVSTTADRLRPAVLSLVVLGFILLVGRTARSGLTKARAAALVLFILLLSLSFTRSTWVPLAAALLLFAVGRPGPRRPLRGIRTSIALIAVAGSAFMLAAAGDLGTSAHAVTARIDSIGNNQVFQENSYQDRAREDAVAWPVIKSHLVTGIGLGHAYGAVVQEHDPITGQTELEPRRFIHNSYLGVWLGMGILGIIALAAFAVAVLRRTLAARGDPSPGGTRAFGAGCALLALGVQATFQTDLYNRSVIATVACAIVFLANSSGVAVTNE